MVIPKAVAPASKRDNTTGAVEVAAECVLNQCGLPKPVTRPSTSKLIKPNKLKLLDRKVKWKKREEQLCNSINYHTCL